MFSHIKSKCIFLSLHWISCTSVCAHCLSSWHWIKLGQVWIWLYALPPCIDTHTDPAEPPPGWAVPDLSASPHRTDTLLSPLPCSGLIIGYPYVSSAGEPVTGPSSPDVSGWCWVYGKDHPLITTVQCVKYHQIHGSVQWGHLLQQNSCVLTHILVPARAEKWAASPSAAPVSRTPSQPSPSTAPPCRALLPKQEQSLPTRLVAEVGWGWDGYIRGNCSTSLIYISVHLQCYSSLVFQKYDLCNQISLILPSSQKLSRCFAFADWVGVAADKFRGWTCIF